MNIDDFHDVCDDVIPEDTDDVAAALFFAIESCARICEESELENGIELARRIRNIRVVDTSDMPLH